MSTIYHKKLDIDYPSIPFIWHYNDFCNLYPTIKSENLNKDRFLEILAKYENIQQIIDIANKNTDTEFYLNIQFRESIELYNSKTNELYVSFHTWLYKTLYNCDIIPDDDQFNVSFSLTCGLFPITNNISKSINFPFKKITCKNKNILLPSGIGIGYITPRKLSIHHTDGYVRFSPSDSCNFFLNSDIGVFVSVANINLGSDIIKSCITLHIFSTSMSNNFEKIVASLM
jgi:hypothetical protein